jgi:hypothetical protein
MTCSYQKIWPLLFLPRIRIFNYSK